MWIVQYWLIDLFAQNLGYTSLKYRNPIVLILGQNRNQSFLLNQPYFNVFKCVNLICISSYQPTLVLFFLSTSENFLIVYVYIIKTASVRFILRTCQQFFDADSTGRSSNCLYLFILVFSLRLDVYLPQKQVDKSDCL